ncbi:methionine ABC transporter ATP-binding protein MetN [Tolumonas auensis]|uniref:methionine ABC transporter ATP-binding protein MetN n=1 Tax=Tolumonas auensis TaxID=43948 RepID=UPI002AA65BC1|nr:methionine ABC transporter ATP-binding protein MetN [Tolumonas auensis]
MIKLSSLSKAYGEGKNAFYALKGIELDVPAGQIVGVIGASGAGKSTLIRCVNLLERPTQGRVEVDGVDLTALDDQALTLARRNIGMIFQHFNLLSSRTVFENVALPLELANWPKEKITARVTELLDLVGLTHRAKAYPSQLSGGQKQRVAIARALGPAPKVLLCDEATSALDPQTTQSILALLKEINQKLGITILLITHEMGVVKSICDSVALLDQGTIIEQGEVGWFFAHAQAPLAKEFIRSSLHLEIPAPYRERLQKALADGFIPLLRLGFSGNTIDTPAISHASRQFGIDVNILSASIEQIGHSRFGFLLVELLGDAAAQQTTIAYLQQQQIDVEVLGYVQQHA